jgi:hypothetical protein
MAVLLGATLAGASATLLNLLLAHVGRDVLVSLPDVLPVVGGPLTAPPEGDRPHSTSPMHLAGLVGPAGGRLDAG